MQILLIWEWYSWVPTYPNAYHRAGLKLIWRGSFRPRLRSSWSSSFCSATISCFSSLSTKSLHYASITFRQLGQRESLSLSLRSALTNPVGLTFASNYVHFFAIIWVYPPIILGVIIEVVNLYSFKLLLMTILVELLLSVDDPRLQPSSERVKGVHPVVDPQLLLMIPLS